MRWHSKALGLLQAIEKSADWALLPLLCNDSNLNLSGFLVTSLHKGVKVELIANCLWWEINFVTLRVLSPESLFQ